MSVWILVHSQFVEVEQFASLNDTKESAFALVDYKAIHLSLVQK